MDQNTVPNASQRPTPEPQVRVMPLPKLSRNRAPLRAVVQPPDDGLYCLPIIFARPGAADLPPSNKVVYSKQSRLSETKLFTDPTTADHAVESLTDPCRGRRALATESAEPVGFQPERRSAFELVEPPFCNLPPADSACVESLSHNLLCTRTQHRRRARPARETTGAR